MQKSPTKSVHYDEDYYAKRIPRELDPYLKLLLQNHVMPARNGSVRVLDVGCGLGVYMRHLEEVGYDAYGIDLSSFASKASKQSRASALFLPFRDSCFDVLISTHLIEHLTPVEIGDFLREARRVLKNSGRIFLITPNLWSVVRPFYGKKWCFDETHVNMFTPASLKTVLRNHGFQGTKISFRVPPIIQRSTAEKWTLDVSVFGKLFARVPWIQDILFFMFTATGLSYFRNVIYAYATPRVTSLGLPKRSLQGPFSIAVVANSLVSSDSMSGGDKILFELWKRWSTVGHPVLAFVCSDALEVAKKNRLRASFRVISDSRVKGKGAVRAYVARLFQSLTAMSKVPDSTIIYASSDFLTDVVPASVLKLISRRAKLVCALYLLAPSPFRSRSAKTLGSLIHFMTQQASLFLMRMWADEILILNHSDKMELESRGFSREKLEVISGGVDYEGLSAIKPIRESHFDACFIGRFHEQKGLEDLLSAWTLVCSSKAEARLAIIGWGTARQVKLIDAEIRERGLERNVELLGFLDGDEKFRMLKSSKILAFPSHRESWGLVACEAMASGVPVVAYDLPVFKEVFPYAMKKVTIGDIHGFAQAIMELLENKDEYERLRLEGLHLASNYDWELVSKRVLQKLSLLTAGNRLVDQ
jgi:glycosyltransferase involved in cell wall biosynthesis/SAM-dependent methyltransferase